LVQEEGFYGQAKVPHDAKSLAFVQSYANYLYLVVLGAPRCASVVAAYLQTLSMIPMARGVIYSRLPPFGRQLANLTLELLIFSLFQSMLRLA
jgi:hypothetical protein